MGETENRGPGLVRGVRFRPEFADDLPDAFDCRAFGHESDICYNERFHHTVCPDCLAFARSAPLSGSA